MVRRLACVLAALLMTLPLAAETTRTLKATLTGKASAPFAVDNLAGTMVVVAGADGEVTAVATIHAEDQALAERVGFEQVVGEDGRPTLRVIYPAGVDTVRYPGAHGTSRVKYDHRRVRVSSGRGELLWAEVEVRVPAEEVDAVFRNVVGALKAEGLRGQLLLDASSGDITASRLGGAVKADTGSGDVHAAAMTGSFTCDTGSGDCRVDGFDGDTLSMDTGSGDVVARGIRAVKVVADTGSGDVDLRDADMEVFEGDTGSGGITVENPGGRLRRVEADTGSGDLTVRLPASSGFELHADTGSGDIACGFEDAHPIAHGREVVGYERGDRQVRIDADTGSGDVKVAPLG